MLVDRVYLNRGEEDEMEVEGYKKHFGKQLLVYIGYLLSGGLLRLLFYWLPHLQLWATCVQCDLAQAEKVFMKDQFDQRLVSTVHTVTREGTGVKIKRPSSVFRRRRFSQLHFSQQPENDSSLIRYFVSKKIKYIWDIETQSFIPLSGLDEGYTLSYFHNSKGMTSAEQSKTRVLYGSNTIAVHVTPVVGLFVKEALSPFYVFQLFSMSVWYADDYWVYATCIAVITSLSLAVTIYQTRTFEKALRNTITSSTTVTVCRGNDEYEDVPSEDLVPGDVIEIPRHGCDMQCDAVLISGNCILNESMLTGESVPVTKTSLPNPSGIAGHEDPLLTMKQHTRHILYNGTHVIQTRFYGNKKVKAVVLRTGFSTLKGELVRAIMFPKPVDFKFQRHSYYFLLVLASLAFMGFIYTVILMVQEEEKTGLIIIRTLDLITIAVPPALPAALAVGVVFSQKRLKNQQVYCISPKGITICGTIDAVCFDKTGTLTEEGLDMHGIVQVCEAKFEPIEKDMKRLSPGPLLTAMATCHSLTIIEREIMGDPLDLIMFQATSWELEEPGPDETRFDSMIPTVVKPKDTVVFNGEWTGDAQPQSYEVGIVRQFPFSSGLQRMSVVTRKLGSSQFELYVKGSPEMISNLSKPETVPKNFHDQLQLYTQHGYRVIGLAWKPLPPKLNYVKVQRISREQVENDLIFLGLIVMENRLKPQSAPVIATLNYADIRTIMITGDNMLTALSVARECGIVEATERTILVQAYPPDKDGKETPIEYVATHSGESSTDEVVIMEDGMLQVEEQRPNFHFAVTGKTWETIRKHFPELLTKLVVKGAVFARMSPDQKSQLVEVLQDIGYYVGMCGDGANDCGALKKAHMGISLSEAEASVASPFTSKIPTIECVPKVVKEGRSALVTSFGVFKYMAMYSLTQFISVLILYWIGDNLTDYEFLYIDLFIITSLSITFSWTGPAARLSKERPLVSLIRVGPILSIITQTALIVGALTYSFIDVKKQPWFVEFEYDEDLETYHCHDNSAIFLNSIYLYTILAITFSKGAPFRRSVFSSWIFIINLIVVFGVNAWLTLYPTKDLADFLELELFPSIKYRASFLIIAVICLLLSLIMEKFIIDNDSLRTRIKAVVERWSHSKGSMYHSIESEIDSDPHWPPVSDAKVNLADIFQRLDSVNQIPPNIHEGKTSLEQILENSEQGENASAEPTHNVDKSNSTVSSSLHLNQVFSPSDHSLTPDQSLNRVSSDMEKLLELTEGSGIYFDQDGSVNTAL